MISIKDFCRYSEACRAGKIWALDNCRDMQEVWERAKPEWLVWIATRRGVLTRKDERRYALFCIEEVKHLMCGESLDALAVAESHINGEATLQQLCEATDRASAVADGAYNAITPPVAGDTYSEKSAQWAAAMAAVYAVRGEIDCYWVNLAIRWSESRTVEQWHSFHNAYLPGRFVRQAAWLRENVKPNFDL